MFFNSQHYMNYLNRPGSDYGVTQAKRQAATLLGLITYNGYYGNYEGAAPEKFTLEQADTALQQVKTAIADRRMDCGPNSAVSIGKWLRPWHVVPELAAFVPPAGDFGVGVEVELGFNSQADSQFVAHHIADWEFVALDWEGPAHPIEATFPPHLHSDFRNSLAAKYLDFLAANPARIYKHAANTATGTHVNVSFRDGACDGLRINAVNAHLNTLDGTELVKYFGRRPYGYGHRRSNGAGLYFIEWKLFNSQTDSTRLQQYVNVAVELTRLINTLTIAIDGTSVRAALEAGYNTPIVATDAHPSNTVAAAPKRTRSRAAA